MWALSFKSWPWQPLYSFLPIYVAFLYLFMLKIYAWHFPGIQCLWLPPRLAPWRSFLAFCITFYALGFVLYSFPLYISVPANQIKKSWLNLTKPHTHTPYTHSEAQPKAFLSMVFFLSRGLAATCAILLFVFLFILLLLFPHPWPLLSALCSLF